MAKLKTMLSGVWYRNNANPVFVGGLILVTAAMVMVLPRSAIGLSLFLASLFTLFWAKLETRHKLAMGVVSLAVLVPIIGTLNRYYLDVAIQIGIYMALALGLNIVVGLAGLLDLGYVAFYATGAYTWAVFGSKQAAKFMHVGSYPLSGEYFWLFLILGVVAAALAGILLGLPVLRLKGDYLAIVTLGFGEIIRIVLNNLDKPVNFTNGPNGITAVQSPAIFGIALGQGIHYYFIVLGLVLLVVTVSRRLQESRIGRAWEAIREDEVAAMSMGIPVVKAKLMAFAMGASFAGAMGVVFAAKQNFVDPSSFSFMESIGVLAMVIMGGMGNVAGALLGATLVTVLQLQVLKSVSDYFSFLRNTGILNLPAQLEIAKYEKFVFGIILIIMMIYRPMGLIPSERRRLELEGKEARGGNVSGAPPDGEEAVPTASTGSDAAGLEGGGR